MLALQSNSKTNLLPVVRDDIFSPPLIKSLVYKPILLTHERKITGRKALKTRNQFSSMGLVIPFQPSMWDDNTIEAALNNTLHKVKTRMKQNYSEECTSKVLTRLQKLFNDLNFNTHRKSVMVILTPTEEKIIYLCFPVRPVVFFSRSASVIDLAANILQEATFYYLILNQKNVSLFDYSNNSPGKVYEKNGSNTDDLYKQTSAIIELLNSENEKPVFITGNPKLVTRFCNSTFYAENYFPLLNHKAPFSSEIIQSLVKEITGHWKYWRSKSFSGKLLLAQKTGKLTSHTEAVVQVLRKSADGLLLIDKRLKQQLQKPGNGIFQIAEELTELIEQFLARGNRFEIMENGLLKDFGGIVLLQSNRTDSMEQKLNIRYTEAGVSLF